MEQDKNVVESKMSDERTALGAAQSGFVFAPLFQRTGDVPPEIALELVFVRTTRAEGAAPCLFPSDLFDVVETVKTLAAECSLNPLVDEGLRARLASFAIELNTIDCSRPGPQLRTSKSDKRRSPSLKVVAASES